eukprot:NODE_2705_length_753_cov_316.639205_g1897_i0.p3 GENE.NODE_2705_length_753_cov_316.639205_g1897_i0~~NODE_2705_length_753_cov_316.639205_g1897_i0.p3  ORF type:complete len:94 (-),score=21.09 NODE_2705_length_753_cov_316.639205_g1897_i0:470-727(-)
MGAAQRPILGEVVLRLGRLNICLHPPPPKHIRPYTHTPSSFHLIDRRQPLAPPITPAAAGCVPDLLFIQFPSPLLFFLLFFLPFL